MQTHFSPQQLADPAIAESESILRKCVHCGFCTATCPTYVLLGDESDSPRGRIVLIKDMLENDRTPTPKIVKHIDRCLSCLACVTTCPSGVNYMHLVDHARAYIHERYRRPFVDRMIRGALAFILPYRRRFKIALRLAELARPLAGIFGKFEVTKPLQAMLSLSTVAHDAGVSTPVAISGPRGKVILAQGCVESVIDPAIRAAAVRLLERAGFGVVFAAGEGCCGALVHHMGREHEAQTAALQNIDAWMNLIEAGDIEAIVTTAAGCGTALKNYGHLLRDDHVYAERASHVSSLTHDVGEFFRGAGLPPVVRSERIVVAYHAACSVQHGQKLGTATQDLLAAAGFDTKLPDEAHLCCGSAGTYNILQPDISRVLGKRKAAHLMECAPDLIATDNIGCAVQLAQNTDVPVLHIVELLDWATGGPSPRIERRKQGAS